MSSVSHDVVGALKSVQHQLQQFASKYNRPSIPRLIAVSKTKPNSLILQAYNAGQRHFGENYVKELIDKQPQLPSDIKWHFIGHLQTNKAKSLVRNVTNLYLVESVDSVKLANELNKACAVRAEKLSILVQVNTSNEQSKSGCEPGSTLTLVEHIVKNCPRLEIKGLMTIGRLADSPQPDCFQLLQKLASEVIAQLPTVFKAETFELSMGMSGDYESAIEFGSTNVRIGSTIFGSRDYSKEMKEDYSKEDPKDKSKDSDEKVAEQK